MSVNVSLVKTIVPPITILLSASLQLVALSGLSPLPPPLGAT